MHMKLAIVGANGLVGQALLQVIQQRSFPFEALLLVASRKSIGQIMHVLGKPYAIMGIQQALDAKPTLAIFSAGTAVSLAWAPKFATIGTTVIDNSAAWRTTHPLIVPEINGHILKPTDKIIANPNCAAIQLTMALAPLHKTYQLKRVVVATYQSVTGSGKKAVTQLMEERQGITNGKKAYAHPIDGNVIPQIDTFLANGYTQEEMKIVNETKKILQDNTIQLTATAVRVPVMCGHALAVNAAFKCAFELQEVIELLQATPGLVVQDTKMPDNYPTPHLAQAKDKVFVGRIRQDPSQPHTLDLWIVADNLRKGAATNAVHIAEWMHKIR